MGYREWGMGVTVNVRKYIQVVGEGTSNPQNLKQENYKFLMCYSYF